MSLPFDSGGRPLHKIHIGGVWAGRTPGVVRTVLGSCIAVCLRDPINRVGGMNHFLLPAGNAEEGANSRYGVHSMELLINECMKNGASRANFEAKVFGGGHVLRTRESDTSVPQINIKFALQFLHVEGIPIVSKDLGGYAARELYFFTDSGRTLMKRLSKTGSDTDDYAALEREERRNLYRQPAAEPAFDESSVTLF